MKKALQLLLLLGLGATSAGCATTKQYFSDRASDLTDVAHIDLTALSLGAGVNAGPAVVGLHFVSAPCGPGFRTKIGLGGVETLTVNEGYAGLIYPLGRAEAAIRAKSEYSRRFPQWGSVGADMGLFCGISARADVVELLDFLLGFFSVDILKDDSKTIEAIRNEPFWEKPEEPWREQLREQERQKLKEQSASEDGASN